MFSAWCGWVFEIHTFKALNIPFNKVILPEELNVVTRKGKQWWFMAARREKREGEIGWLMAAYLLPLGLHAFVIATIQNLLTLIKYALPRL